MSRPTLKMVLLVMAVAVLSAGGGYWIAHRTLSPAGSAKAAAAPSSERQVLYWYDPMVPSQHFDKPGKSPFMDMELVPKYADAAGGADTGQSGLKIDSALTENLGVRYAVVERGALTAALQVPASVVFNERDLAIVQTRTAGFVERVYARAPGDVIAADAPLLDLLVPEWAGAQAEYLSLKQAGEAELTHAARERLRLLGMPDAVIRQLDANSKPQTTFTVRSPLGGVIQSLEVRQGMTVSPGMTVATINGLGTVWIEAALPEAQAAAVKPRQAVTAQVAAYPGEAFTGRVSAVLPEANTQTRTLRVRMEFANPKGRLRPGMFARVDLQATGAADTLIVPSEAVIRTGRRTLVIVVDAQGRFQPVEVQPGREAAGKTVIVSGLSAGQKVVASGQFLIDSEASLAGVLTRMQAAGATPAEPSAMAAQAIEANGVIEAIGPADITLSHEPIPALDWPAMTMAFPLDKAVSPQGFKKGQRVHFALEKRGEELVIVRLRPMEALP